MTLRPIFVFAVSRSGSTLLQRMLASHPKISSHAEPFFLLPLLLPLQPHSGPGIAWQRQVYDALQGIETSSPGAITSYLAGIRSIAADLYSRVAEPGSEYFVDKTPPYYEVVDEIIRAFPDARYVFLWRAPHAVVASCVETWEGGHWELGNYRRDWFTGLPALTAAYEAHRDRAHALRFEDLVTDAPTTLRGVFEYIGVPFQEQVVEDFSGVRFGDVLGDQTGSRRYRVLSTEPLTKWHDTICNPLRRRWCVEYLEWLGEARLRTMGYDLAELRDELEASATSWQRLEDDALALARLALRESLQARAKKRAAPSSFRALLSTKG